MDFGVLKQKLKVDNEETSVVFDARFLMVFENIFGIDLDDLTDLVEKLKNLLDPNTTGMVEDFAWDSLVTKFTRFHKKDIENNDMIAYLESKLQNDKKENVSSQVASTVNDLLAKKGSFCVDDPLFLSVFKIEFGVDLEHLDTTILESFKKKIDRLKNGIIDEHVWKNFKGKYDRYSKSNNKTMTDYLNFIATNTSQNQATTIEAVKMTFPTPQMLAASPTSLATNAIKKTTNVFQNTTVPVEPRRLKEITFVCIGAPGHGKSTCLNEFAGEEFAGEKKLFATSASGSSCTQAGNALWDKKNHRDIHVVRGNTAYTMHLVDTPGFPDPDLKKAAECYDWVIKACNEKINGVLYVMRPERAIQDTMNRYRVLMRQFINLRVPMILLINGRAITQRKRESDSDYETRRKKDIDEFRKSGREVLSCIGLHVREMLISYNQDELFDVGKDVAVSFSLEEPKTSNIKTLQELQDDVDRCRDSKYAAEKERNEFRTRIGTVRRDLKAVKASLAYYEGELDDPFNWLVPVIGWANLAYSKHKAEIKRSRIRELEQIEQNFIIQHDNINEAKLKEEYEKQKKELDELLSYLQER
uniref:G domain-containing protein n=1 Tax=Aureoumbra lagunensis TaxID=44058 RepID=A0A7S3JXW6_9STRA